MTELLSEGMDAVPTHLRFSHWCERCGLNLRDLAQEFGEAIETVRLWQNGSAQIPQRVLRTVAMLADFSPIQANSASDGTTSPVTSPRPSGESVTDVRTRKASLGQFLTPPGIARFMASLFCLQANSDIRLLDAGAGRAALTDAFVKRWQAEKPGGKLAIDAYESDPAILPALQLAIDDIRLRDIDARAIEEDFVARAALAIRSGQGRRYTHAILNPPYKKIGNASPQRSHFRLAGLETVNLYSGFVGLALELLEPGGELVAIIPRSFCNGPYYRDFRRLLLDRCTIRQMHLFEARDQAFRQDKVLQENVIIHLQRGATQGGVVVSTSRDERFSDYSARTHSFERIVAPDDAEAFIHIPVGEEEELSGAAFGHTLDEIGLRVSTGPVVDFRLRPHLRDHPETGAVPLLYPGHFTNGALDWPKAGFKKPNAIVRNGETEKWLYPAGHYTVVRRFSSKEERHRIVANVVEPNRPPGEMIGFENHLNVFHCDRGPLAEALAWGLAVYLNSSSVDRNFRRFNGHTQVNATDLRALRYPGTDSLETLGRWAISSGPGSQAGIDRQVELLR